MASSKQDDFGFKIWKWRFSLKFGQRQEQPCCAKAKELTAGLKRDSSWEFFRFGAIKSQPESYITSACKRHRRNLDIIRDRSKSMANLYYTPIDSDPNFEDESSYYVEIPDWTQDDKVEIEPLPLGCEASSIPQIPPKAPRFNCIEVVPMLPPYPSTKATSGGRKRHYTGK